MRNGYEQIRVSFTIKGDAPPAVLEKIVEQSRKRSAVYDVLTNGVPVTVVRERGLTSTAAAGRVCAAGPAGRTGDARIA